MPIFPLFPEELLSDDDEEDEKHATTYKHTKEPARGEEPIALTRRIMIDSTLFHQPSLPKHHNP
ncbi:hypothetical protein J1N35_040812, partial [Gossypium stocksii]